MHFRWLLPPNYIKTIGSLLYLKHLLIKTLIVFGSEFQWNLNIILSFVIALLICLHNVAWCARLKLPRAHHINLNILFRSHRKHKNLVLFEFQLRLLDIHQIISFFLCLNSFTSTPISQRMFRFLTSFEMTKVLDTVFFTLFRKSLE